MMRDILGGGAHSEPLEQVGGLELQCNTA
jgi:hypothetical protein